MTTKTDDGTIVAAQLVIHGAAEMTSAGRSQIAQWLRDHASCLLEKGTEYAPTFVAGYRYSPE